MSSPASHLPSFVIVGQPNAGKTTLLATLTENDQAEIGPVPGTTTRARPYTIHLDDRAILSVIDTPGFERQAELLDWLEANEAAADEPALALLEYLKTQPGFFEMELEILRPIAEGAVVVFVADANRPARSVDRDNIEILRRCATLSVAVINERNKGEEAGRYREGWLKVLRRNFNIICSFDPHHASFADRIELLRRICVVDDGLDQQMRSVIGALENSLEERCREMCDAVLELLEKAMRFSATAQIGNDPQLARKKAEQALTEHLKQLEEGLRKRVRQTLRHSQERWETEGLLALDLMHEETWRVLGLTRKQLLAVGAASGGIAGGGVDLALGGTSLGAMAAFGAAVGAAGAWFGASQAIHIEMPGPMRTLLGNRSKTLGGREAVARIHPKSNLRWILLDRALLYIEHASHWAHSRREAGLIRIERDAEAPGNKPPSQRLSDADRKKLAELTFQLSKGPTSTPDDRLYAGVRVILRQAIKDIVLN